MIPLAEGTVEKSGIKFRILVSEAVDPEDMRAIADLLHAGAAKYEAEHQSERG